MKGITGFFGTINEGLSQPMKSEKTAVLFSLILLLITIVSVACVFLLPPIPQWLSYHQFADTRKIWGIPNFWDVVSNLPFLLVGMMGLFAMSTGTKPCPV